MIRWLPVLLCLTPTPTQDSALPPALERDVRAATVGDENRIGYTPEELGGWRYRARLPLFDAWIEDAFRFERTAHGIGMRFAAARGPAQLVAEGWTAGGFELAPAEELEVVLGEASEDAGAAAEALWDFVGEAPPREALAEAVAGLPESASAPIARFLGVLPRCVDAWTRAVESVEPGALSAPERALRYFDAGAETEVARLLDREFDRAWAGRAAVDFVAAVEALAGELAPLRFSARTPDVVLPTPYGDVFFGSGGKSEHGPTPRLLLVDVSGHDRYLPGTACAQGPQTFSAVIDLRGNDTFEADGTPTGAGAGSGLLGVGVLVDCRGDDHYSTERFGAGLGAFGAGVLYDLEGDDRYVGSQHCQALGLAGVGLVLDEDGDDHYELFTYGQGLGCPLGAGLLIDLGGDDEYTARDDELRSPSPQTGEHNVSMAQGCGYGYRDDGRGRDASGGFGLLLDHAGNDVYRGAVFAQAIGYWYGVGMLFDLEGADSYEAVWYGQSASAHFALSYLFDAQGKDRYRTTMSQSLGNGRDFSISVFHDAHGDDDYFAPDRSLGCGDVNGVGLFLDGDGTDRYRFKGEVNGGRASFGPGDPSPGREDPPTVGIFLDLGKDGDDYGRLGLTNDGRWVSEGRLPGMRGIAIDDGP